MIGRWIVGIAFFLHDSLRYRRVKKFFHNLLENPAYPYKKFFDYTMMVLIVISVYILVHHVKYEVKPDWLFFNNYVISVIFMIEYLLRLWVYSDNSKVIIEQYEHDLFLQRPFKILVAFRQIIITKSKFVFSLSAIIDLLAIMPFFHEMRLLRVFILFRVFKLFRYAKSLQQFVSILASKKFEFLTLGVFASVIITVSSVLIYVMEANNPESPINTLFEAVYWSVVTIFTVGYGDFVPVTSEGRTVAMVIIVAGIAVIAFTTSIVVSAFTEKLDEIKEDKLIDDVSKFDQFYLICGYGPLAAQVARRFLKNGKQVIIIESNHQKVAEAQKEGFLALAYNPASLHSYHTIRINFETQVIAAILLEESDVLNVYTALTIREISKKVKILSILLHHENRRKLTLAGIDEVVYTQELVGLMSKEVSGRPVAFEVIHALRSENNGVFIEEIVLDTLMAQHFFETTKHSMFHKRLIVLGVYKQLSQSFFFNPSNTLVIEEGDVVIVVGTRSLIDEFKIQMRRKKRS
ncbi:MAG: potassium transporter TrkA [Sulfuricurvum sp. PD_MW2]|jgi:voltage-gated potassium channel|uniref:ion transporter n=1 Tax=Sulfuricurvum sp. PD_MW2 TaxID=2027917 RepID=UPI000C0647E1|nr:ion transporter [Sulfuricurvum sp. PD_MW2]PHM16651.1 MAG: potassium transporter TrkA [Sulfuricurvum sp. PD_MW2]